MKSTKRLGKPADIVERHKYSGTRVPVKGPKPATPPTPKKPPQGGKK